MVNHVQKTHTSEALPLSLMKKSRIATPVHENFVRFLYFHANFLESVLFQYICNFSIHPDFYRRLILQK